MTLTFQAQHDLHLPVAHERRLATAQHRRGTAKNGRGSLQGTAYSDDLLAYIASQECSNQLIYSLALLPCCQLPFRLEGNATSWHTCPSA